MKIQRFNEDISEKITPEMKDFTEWCLLKNLENRRYFFKSHGKTWYDDMEFRRLSWDEIYEVYIEDKAKKYNL